MASEGGCAPTGPDDLKACGLPAAWAGQPQWRILETGFGRGLNFLAAWRAWKDDPCRPRILHFVSIDDSPAPVEELLRAAQGWPLLQPLAKALAGEWYGLLPGVHRLVFEQGHVLLTLCLGDVNSLLREQDFHADSVFLGAPRPHPGAIAAEPLNLKALARRCRRGSGIAAADPRGELAAALARHGFAMRRNGDSPAAPHLVCGEFAPAWEPRGPGPKAQVEPADCIVIGAGLAGAAAAASLARRGWQVQVLDAASAPASGASGLPAGLLVPHSSPDDNLLSRLTRAGVRATLHEAQELLEAGVDWEPSGVFEHQLEGTGFSHPQEVSEHAGVWSRPADARQKQLAGLDDTVAAQWHEKAGWIRPARLAQVWLAQPGVRLKRHAKVAKLVREGRGWQALDRSGLVLARGELVVVAAACASDELLEGLTLQPVRGQVSWGLREAHMRLPPFPVNGDGSFIPSVPMPDGPAWLCGASFDRGDIDRDARQADDQANLARLGRLLPHVAHQLEAAFANGTVQGWTGIRCASTDRRPLVGEHNPTDLPGVWLSTAMGSRGLTFAALSGELIAAQVHGEPLPLARKLARSLSAIRRKKPVESRAVAGA